VVSFHYCETWSKELKKVRKKKNEWDRALRSRKKKACGKKKKRDREAAGRRVRSGRGARSHSEGKNNQKNEGKI